MTRWGLLSDIHGNLLALERAVQVCREQDVERFAVLGDNLGRGDSDGCIALIRAVAEVSVQGNRDLDWQHRVSEQTAEYVLGLPRLVQTDDFVATHGDARLTRDLSSGEIRSGFRRAPAWLAEHTCRIWVFGHTHRARVWRLGASEPAAVLLFDGATRPLPQTISLDDGDPATCWAVNVGSVGLPFGGKGPASFAILDTAARTVEFLPVLA